MIEPYADDWPDAGRNSFGCWQLAIAELRRRFVAQQNATAERGSTAPDQAAMGRPETPQRQIAQELAPPWQRPFPTTRPTR